MKARSLFFTAPEQVAVRESPVPEPGEGQLLVQTLVSAISPGTEMLVYRGQVPADLALDETIAALSGGARYPFKYGYSSVGQVIAAGPGVEPGWLGRKVFAFNPHESHYLAQPEHVMPLPDGIEAETAVFLPNMETAVNFIMDGQPLIGESVGVFGLGIVGLLTSALLAEFPLGGWTGWDRYPRRRDEASRLGAALALDPSDASAEARARAWLAERGSPDGFDLVYELSGSPAALDQAIALAGFAGRVVIGSWYGTKQATLNLGGRFHRSRLKLIASQVSTVAPELSARWSKARRMGAAWDALRRVCPARWITQRFPFERAADAYRLIAEHPEETLQVVLTYD